MGRLTRFVNALLGGRGGESSPPQSSDIGRKPGKNHPDALAAMMMEGVSSHRNGDLDAAGKAYQAVLDHEPEHAGALHLLGVVCGQRGDQDRARMLIERALALEPDNPAFLVDFGNAHHARGDMDEAMKHYRRALEVAPGDANANRSWAYAQLERGNRPEAIAHLQKALEVDPGVLQDRLNLAKALAEEHRHEEAIPHFLEVTEAAPDLALAHHLLAHSYRSHGQLEKSARHYEKAIALAPDDYVTRNDFGVLLHQLGNVAGAIENLKAAIRLNPDFSGARVNLGNVFKSQRKLVDACRQYEKAVESDPEDSSAHNNLGTVLKDLGRVDEGLRHYRRAIELRNDFIEAESSLLLALQYPANVSLDELRQAHVKWAKRWAGRAVPRMDEPANTRDPERPLRIGYVSPDFRTHPIGLFLAPVLEAHDASNYRVVCYHDQFTGDGVTDRLRSLSDEWRQIAGVGNLELARLIRDDGIDVLVDMAGHTANNRLLMFATRPAPVQVTWIGYLHSTGLEQMDYLLADDVSVPPDTAQWFSEKVVRLPECSLCYGLPSDTPDIGALPAIKNGHVTFACFNNLAKITDDVILHWVRILKRVGSSRLVIRNQAFHDEEFRRIYAARLAGSGIPADRVALENYAPRGEYFASYNEVDVMLDPFPFSGGTITCDALWMGAPVVTLAGDRMASRTSASVLCALGLEELVAESGEAYVDRAASLAEDLDRLAMLRAGMRARFRDSALGDAERFTRNLESAYREMWVNWCGK